MNAIRIDDTVTLVNGTFPGAKFGRVIAVRKGTLSNGAATRFALVFAEGRIFEYPVATLTLAKWNVRKVK